MRLDAKNFMSLGSEVEVECAFGLVRNKKVFFRFVFVLFDIVIVFILFFLVLLFRVTAETIVDIYRNINVLFVELNKCVHTCITVFRKWMIRRIIHQKIQKCI